jgi:hypothetical protein
MPEDQIQKNIKPRKFEYAGKVGRFLSHCRSDFISAHDLSKFAEKFGKQL